MTATIRAVDLFAGAGGLSWGLVEALREVAVDADALTQDVLEQCIDLVAVNHWETAIETHERNHPWARHFHDDVQNVDPREVFDEPDPDVKILSGGIECTHWSTARGGKPVDEQKRMPAWDFLTWVQKLRPEVVLVENVKEFAKWGPIEDDGTPSRNGETFEQWINSLHALGYSVDWQVPNAADYGDATSRERLFIMARREGRPEFPDPTHSDADDELPDRRTAAEIIDWSDPGESIWTRSRPLVENTMQRIAEGIRRHGADRLEPFADAVGSLGKPEVEAMQERIVPAEYAHVAAQVCEEPFLVATGHETTPALASPHLTKYYGTATAKPIGEPVDTITSGGQKFGLCTPYLIGQQSGATARAVDAQPVPTIATDGYVRVFDAQPFVLPRNGVRGGLHSNATYPPASRPLHTVTAKNHDGWIVSPALMQFSHGGKLLNPEAPLPTITTAKGGVFAISQPQPFLVQYHGQSGAQPIDAPTPTLTAKDSLALVVPDLFPWGLDVRFRMLQPRELAAAQGFPAEYDFAGTKTETVEQIGNAVPVTLAQRLVESLLASTTPSLTDYLGPETEPRVAADGGESA